MGDEPETARTTALMIRHNSNFAQQISVSVRLSVQRLRVHINGDPEINLNNDVK